MVVRTLEKEIMDSYCLMDTVSVWIMKKVLEMDNSDGCTMI